MAAVSMRRSIISTAEGVPSTFSSWNNCMSQAYCKWPAIIGIVIGSLIVLSIIWCLARCLCCGASCCCSCLRCLDCFTPGRHRNRDSRYKEDYRPMPNQGFQPMPSPMIYQPGPPQFATFDTPSHKVNEDSLPSMPTWNNAQERHVEEEQPAQGHGDDVELGRVTSNQNPARGGYSQLSHGPGSPAAGSPYGHSAEYFGAGGLQPQESSHASPPHPNFEPNRTTSPAPTYATHDPQINTLMAAGDHFAADGIVPTPQQYNQAQFNGPSSPASPPNYASRPPSFRPQPQGNNFSRPSALPPLSTASSTRYEPSTAYAGPGSYAPSPYAQPYSSQQQYQQQPSPSPYGGFGAGGGYQRVGLNSPTTGQSRGAPGLLQAGVRKPVGGTYREV